MSINNIQLPAALVFDLYDNLLSGEPVNVLATGQSKETQPVLAAEENTAFNWPSLGNNKQQVLVVVNYKDVTHLPDRQLQFLTQMLNACKLSLNEVAIINTNNYSGYDHAKILTHFNSKMILLFGFTAAQFGFPFNIPDYQVQQHAGYTMVQSISLDKLEADKTAKGQIWANLKTIFGL